MITANKEQGSIIYLYAVIVSILAATYQFIISPMFATVLG